MGAVLNPAAPFREVAAVSERLPAINGVGSMWSEPVFDGGSGEWSPFATRRQQHLQGRGPATCGDLIQ